MTGRSDESSGMDTYDVLAIVLQTIQDQGDQQKERIDNTALDGVPDHSSIETVQPMVRSELCRVLGLFHPPDDETSDNEVGHERDGEQGWSDVLNSRGEGRLTGGKVGEFPDRHRD